ncbi:cytochrome c oxidase subunit II [Jannaschia sp. W003]|uniref:cytochrome c oxidase subunit II n=1 Tax=Jannaschia sp. W003 TaxID=2867012 RepID=UPI0021A2B7B5|nr:cytochrome c oxidase subunit II [Jannaschia sp. W003]UWQ22949.1 cytochrome c oxidase subunit II [Jannaschia sp. W003]
MLAPAGEDAAVLATLWWWMLGGAVVLWLLLNGAFFYVTRIGQRKLSRAWAEGIIVGGGVVFPAIVLAALLTFGLGLMPDMRAPGDALRVHVQGEQWWWRVHYETPEGTVVSANEVRLPAGARSEIVLTAGRVIHSFWVPALGGKMDLIPGRVNRTSYRPTEPGTYRGQCAEFCGEAHAQMAFETVVMEPDDFAAWLAAEAAPARPPEGVEARRGAEVFRAEGCGACHAIRGTEARGRVGPDLTHVGSRVSLSALLPNDEAGFARWIVHTDRVKPGVRMPSYPHIPASDLAALAAYMEGLQ